MVTVSECKSGWIYFQYHPLLYYAVIANDQRERGNPYGRKEIAEDSGETLQRHTSIRGNDSACFYVNITVFQRTFWVCLGFYYYWMAVT